MFCKRVNLYLRNFTQGFESRRNKIDTLFMLCIIEESTEATLQARVQELEEKQHELQSAMKAKEDEFGKRRAQFKDLFLQKESKLI